MNFKQIKQKLDELNITAQDLSGDGDYEKTADGQEFQKFCEQNPTKKSWDLFPIYLNSIFGEVRQVYSYGGEGKGDEYVKVWFFVDHNVHVRMDAYYSSHEGVYYDDATLSFCIPKEKTIVVYERPTKEDLRDIAIQTVIG